MCESFHAWPARDDAPSLRFQPVFTGQGQVHEYAVVDRPTPSAGGLSDIGAQRARLRAEGVTVRNNRVDMSRHGWRPMEHSG